METRNQASEKDIKYYFQQVGLIRGHLPLQSILNTHLTRMARMKVNDDKPAVLKVVRLSERYIPKQYLDLTREVIRFINPFILCLDFSCFDSCHTNDWTKNYETVASILPESGITRLQITGNDPLNLYSRGQPPSQSVFFNMINALKATPGIVSLNLSQTRLGDLHADLRFVFFSEIRYSQIRFLDLRDNHLDNLDKEEWNYFCQCVKQSKAILKVDVRGNHLSSGQIEQLDGILAERNKLGHIAARFIARNFSLFKEINFIEVLPEPCNDLIDKARAGLGV